MMDARIIIRELLRSEDMVSVQPVGEVVIRKIRSR